MVIKAIVEWKNPFIRRVSYVVFFPLSLLFGIAAEIRNKLYDFQIFRSVAFESFIIGIGSLSVGGSGKTPLVEFLAQLLAHRGTKVGVVSNGYGKKGVGAVIVSDGKNLLADVFKAGDEAYLMAVNFQKHKLNIPVISSSDRVEAIHILEMQFHCDVVILDDAFQYRKITKSVEFIVQDYLESGYPFFTLPAGRLREFRRNVKRADAVILTKSPEGDDAKKISERWSHEVYISHYLPAALQNWFAENETSLDFLTNKKILLFSALGYNESFQRCAAELCSRYHAQLMDVIEFQDHHWYAENDILRICSLIPQKSASEYVVLTTQKDAVKIKPEWLPEKLREQAYFIKSEFSMNSQIQFENMINIPQITPSDKHL